MPASRPSRPAAPKPSAPRPAPRSGLTVAQRLRVRKIVRWVLLPVIVLQVAAFGFLMTPAGKAFTVNVNSTVLQPDVAMIRSNTRQTVDVLQDIRRNTDDLVEDAELHSERRDDQVNDFQTAAVSTERMQEAFNANRPNAIGGNILSAGTNADPLHYFSDDPAAALAAIAPGVTKWDNRHLDMARADDATLMTLRAGMASLKSFHDNMQEDDQRFRDLMQQARSEPSRLAVAQLQVEANMEVARQLQALRAQQALQSNLDIVTATREISEAARNNAHVAKGNCEMMTQMIGDGLGGIVGAGAEALSAQAFCVE